ncbi:hypothetical protein QJS04_geneDACA001641 [Acorus gramineus]|uniref:Uncharacterized protein n=1 Tax=Acorus gramineus TaxID=55184 RepID=A0AAV9BH58_ACOGR|nr:hypothetical protein QJS04_geneDACA001641 [Acorus gramineus]
MGKPFTNNAFSDEALSLYDLRSVSEKEEYFEFRVLGNEFLEKEEDMCAADYMFFQGHILPLRPSTHSNQDHIHGSSNRSNNSSRSSKSHPYSSTTTQSSFSSQHRTVNKFYAHPSPNPQIRSSVNHHRRPSIGGWGLMRVGLIKTPEMEVHNLRSRRKGLSDDGDLELEKKNNKHKKKKASRFSCKWSSVDVVAPSHRVCFQFEPNRVAPFD